jgi:hypothetical protein
MKKFFIQNWMTKNGFKMSDNDICPYCHSSEISDIEHLLDDKVRGATVLFYCSNCEGIFGYGT